MKEEIGLPKDYFPYFELTICGNTLVNVQIPFLIERRPLLLIGKNSVPQVWLSARTSPGSHEWKYIVQANRSLNPAVYVEAQDENRTVYVRVSNTVIIRAVAQSETKAVVDVLDLRPVGLNVYGNSSGLSLATNRYAGNSMMNLQVAFALGK
jgi:hypothetical protein